MWLRAKQKGSHIGLAIEEGDEPDLRELEGDNPSKSNFSRRLACSLLLQTTDTSLSPDRSSLRAAKEGEFRERKLPVTHMTRPEGTVGIARPVSSRAWNKAEQEGCRASRWGGLGLRRTPSESPNQNSGYSRVGADSDLSIYPRCPFGCMEV